MGDINAKPKDTNPLLTVIAIVVAGMMIVMVVSFAATMGYNLANELHNVEIACVPENNAQ